MGGILYPSECLHITRSDNLRPLEFKHYQQTNKLYQNLFQKKKCLLERKKLILLANSSKNSQKELAEKSKKTNKTVTREFD